MDVDSTPTETSDAPTAADAQRRLTSNYVMSAQKPTVVNACVVGNFRNEADTELIISRINRIEMLLVADVGLKPYRELPIFGRIALIRAFKVPGEKKDSLLLLTCKNQIAVLGFNTEGEVRTRASGNLTDKVARQAETGMLASVHKSGLIALRLYEGLLKIVQWSDDKGLTCYNLRFGDAQISDFTFLDSKDSHGRPAIAYIYQDSNGRHLKVCGIDTREKELSVAWKQDNIESEASLLVPVPFYGGVVVIGQESISYHKDAAEYTAVAPPFIHTALICCYALIDPHGERILLGDIQGKLYMLVLITQEGERQRKIMDIKIQLLGEISIPECLVYLDNSVVFIGSRLGDSQLVRIVAEPNEYTNNTFVEVLDSFPNLGPIRDLIVVNVDGQNQIVTCSGGYKEGSLRVIRSGIGIEEAAFFPLANVRHLFAFALGSTYDNYLVVSFVNVTHLFKVDQEEWADSEIAGFDLSVPTLYAGVLHESGALVQVTGACVNVIGADAQPRASHATTISLCAVNTHASQLLIASGPRLVYMRVSSDGALEEAAALEFERDISCVDLACVDERAPSKLAAIGLWDVSAIHLLRVGERSIERLSETAVTGDVLSRSVLITRMEGILYTMLALGDGTLYYYQLDEATGTLTEEKKATAGTRPTRLKRFHARNATNIFACSDRPAVIFSANQKLLFSNVNLKLVNEMCPLNTSNFPNSLAFADTDHLFIGQIDDIQKLHVRSVPLGESVSRIAHQEETNTIAILTQRQERFPIVPTQSALPSTSVSASSASTADAANSSGTNGGGGGVDSGATATVGSRRSVPTMCASRVQLALSSGATSGRPTSAVDADAELVDVHSVCVLDANTFEVLHVVELPATEYAISLCAASLGDSTTPQYVVGTAYVASDEPECKLGRVLVFVWEGGRLRLIHEKEVKGAVFSVETLNNKLVCGINSSVRLYAWTTEQELRMEASSFNFINALHVKTKGDLVLVGDLMRSVTMLAYRHTEAQFEEVAQDYQSEWITACEIIDSDTVIVGENAYNMFTCYKDVQADNDDERARFQQTGYWHLGENVNVFRRGTLHASSNEAGSALSYSNPIIYGTADGGLGLIVQLAEPTFKYVRELQARIAKNLSNCTRIDYNDYRNYCTERNTCSHEGFVDGDLVEALADMPRERAAKIVAGLKPPPDADHNDSCLEQILRLIEDLARLH